MRRPLDSVAVVGTGVLGMQIAMVSAYAGYRVSVYDTRETAFDETYENLFADLKAKGTTPFIPWDDWEECKIALCTGQKSV